MSAPVIDPRSQVDVLTDLTTDSPGYTPEWTAGPGATGLALMRIFARYASILIGGLNTVPQRALLAFLDMLGTHLLPAQAARAPLIFTLAENCPVDVTLPENSEVAAVPAPVLPSLSSSSSAASNGATPLPVVFATQETITLSRGRLASLYSIDPSSDQYAEHTSSLTSGFSLFDDMKLTEHAIYLGHDSLFAFNGAIKVLLLIGLRAGANAPLSIEWEYLAQTGWVLLTSAAEDDTTGGLQHDGTIILQRDCAPAAKQDTLPQPKQANIASQSSYWIRGKLTSPMFPDGIGGKRTVPVINTIHARLSISKSDLLPEAAFADSVSLDPTKQFFPFGQQPVTYSTFYLASKEAFQRRGARINLQVTLDQPGKPGSSNIGLTWEYFAGATWNPLDTTDGTKDFTSKDTPPLLISFLCPRDWQTSKVNGKTNYWLRVRITTGDYGQPIHVVVDSNGNPSLASSSLNAPVVAKLTLSYTYLTDPELLDYCLSRNDSVFEDHSDACHWFDQTFVPFHPVADVQPAVHFGFDQPLPLGLLSLYAGIPMAAARSGVSSASSYVWEYLSASGWNELGVLDETGGFQRSGMIQFVGQPDAIAAPGLGGELYWIRARLKQGDEYAATPISGMWLNAVWASQRSSYSNDVTGISDGNPGQTFLLRHTPVLVGEAIEVQEWTGSGDGWRTALPDVPESDLRIERDVATRVAKAVWVRWHEESNLYNSRPRDRHYVIERARGFIRFGPPGMIPPAGAPISASYSSGGGMAGNVPAGAISELHTAVPYLMKVTNPIAASGGTDPETTDSVVARGPQAIRHLNRAVSPSDYEWLARDASPDVARALCTTITGPDGHAQRGWVTLVVVPRSLDAQPEPTPEFQTRLLDYISLRAPFSATSRIRLLGPKYATVGVWMEVVTKQADQAAQLEAQLRDRLNQFLHPLSGGPGGQGWDFGQSVYISQVASIIQATPGVSYTPGILLRLNGQVFDEFVPVEPGSLIAAGTHEIKVTIGQA